MKVVYPVEFLPRQRDVILTDCYENLVEGNKGSGKTKAIISKIYFDCMRHKNIHWTFFRRTLPECRETFLKYALECYPKGSYIYKVAQNRIVFPTGSYCSLGHIENDKDLSKYQGFSFHRVCFDEATAFTARQIGYIKAQTRSDNKDVPAQIFYSTNPGGISHGWFKQRFIDNKVPYVKYETPESVRNRAAKNLGIERAVYLIRHRLMLEDNKFLLESDPDYMARLDELPEDDKPALRDGSWDILSGQFFKINDTHKIKSYEPSCDDTIFISCDWGTSKPFSIGWFAVKKDEHVVMYREYYGISARGIDDDGCNMTAEEVAYKIIEKTPMTEVIRYMVLDTACWSDGGHGVSIYEIMQNILKSRNIYIIKANKDRVNGWECMKKYLSVDKYTNTPFMQITEECKHFWRTVPYMIYSDKKYLDMDDNGENHSSEMCRYFCMSRPMPKRITESLQSPQFSLNWFHEQDKLKKKR